MAATSVGQIGLDLVVNENKFNKQMSGIESLAKKAGVALAGAFAVKKLVQFGSKCVELGSDLAEVQNVVDVTFPRMTAQVDNFAKSAATSFGLSETMAKKFTGTFGAMSKSFGFSEKAAYEMSTTLTGLAGDVASFYNLSQDEAYTKLKSVFTGETETLKDLGVVMTQSALDAYAMANGFGKTTSAMSEQEKVALRYAFVQDKLAAAQGDFARTSDSWANQVRILKLQMESFMATVGQGFINLLTPVLKVINTIIGKIMSLANAFKAFTELITGKKAQSGLSTVASSAESLGDTAATSLGGASDAAGSLADSTDSVGDAATNAVKKMRQLMGFDAINKLSDNDSSTSSGGSGSGGSGGSGSSGGATGDEYDFGELESGETILDETSEKFQKIIDKAKELADLFRKGFEIGFGNSEANIQRIQDACSNIGSTLREIFTDSSVVQAAEKLADAIALNLGKITGSIANVGIAIATNLTEGIAKSLDEQKDFIKEKISSILTIEAEWWNLQGDVNVALSDIISSALTSDAATQITADIASIITQMFLGAFELVEKLRLDITSMIVTPIIENKEKIKKSIEETLKPISDAVSTLKKAVTDAFEAMNMVYDEHIGPMFDAFEKGISDTFGKFLDSYNENVAPTLDRLAKKFDDAYTNHIKPAMDKTAEALGPVIDVVKELYLKVVKPFVDWCVENLVPICAKAFEIFGDKVIGTISKMADIFGDVMEIIGGLATAIEGLFTRDYSKVWDGLKQAGEGLKNLEVDVVLNGKTDKSFDKTKENYDSVKSKEETKSITGKKDSLFDKAVGWWGEITGSTETKTITGKKESIFDSAVSWWNGISSNTATKTITGKKASNWNSTSSTYGGVKSNTATKTISGKKASNWNSISKAWSSIKSKTATLSLKFSAAAANLKSWINTNVISKVNNAFSKVPILRKIKIPRLAQGGYVQKNTPQLAMIGDNRHQGEIVAPEDKLRKMALEAARMADSGGDNSALIAVLKEILEIIKNTPLMRLDEESLRKYFIQATNANTMKNKYCELKV